MAIRVLGHASSSRPVRLANGSGDRYQYDSKDQPLSGTGQDIRLCDADHSELAGGVTLVCSLQVSK